MTWQILTLSAVVFALWVALELRASLYTGDEVSTEEWDALRRVLGGE